jgi:protein CpxP
MKKRTLIFLVAAAMVTVLAVPFAIAQHRHRMHGSIAGDDGTMMLGRLQHAKAALGLTDQQAADIKTIFTDLRAQNEPYRTSLRGGHQAIAQLLLANPNDIAGAQALIDKQGVAERQMKVNMLTAASKALNVLTPDQRAKAATFMQQRMARHAEK